MEIERKYLVRELPSQLDSYPCLEIEQAYLCTSPVIRIRKENDTYYVTCKGQGMLSREECNLTMNGETYYRLLLKAEGTIIRKQRYVIPLEDGLHTELDIFHGRHKGLQLVEVEFPNTESANSFTPPSWFGDDVSSDPCYRNSFLASLP